MKHSSGNRCGKCGGMYRRDIDGLVCVNCSARVWNPVETVITIDPLRKDEPRQVYVQAQQTMSHYIAVKFYDSILEQRLRSASWFTIARLLKQSGHNCQERTLQKYFLLEHDRRCGDGKAA